jgi:hypothetical protein
LPRSAAVREVARWFFSVGGAAGTIAKTISAYDTAVSERSAVEPLRQSSAAQSDAGE